MLSTGSDGPIPRQGRCGTRGCVTEKRGGCFCIPRGLPGGTGSHIIQGNGEMLELPAEAWALCSCWGQQSHSLQVPLTLVWTMAAAVSHCLLCMLTDNVSSGHD